MNHFSEKHFCGILVSFGVLAALIILAGPAFSSSLLEDTGSESEWDGLSFRTQEVRYKFGEADGVCKNIKFPQIYATSSRIFTRWNHSLSNGSLEVALVNGNLVTAFDGLRVSAAHITAKKHQSSLYLKVKVYSRESLCSFALLFEDVLTSQN